MRLRVKRTGVSVTLFVGLEPRLWVKCFRLVMLLAHIHIRHLSPLGVKYCDLPFAYT
jgi:hypothetical protein